MRPERKRMLDKSLGEGWELAEEYECVATCEYLDLFEGYAAMTKIDKAAMRLAYRRDGREICILDDGYVWIQVMPVGKNHSVILMMDENLNMVQWYFDISLENSLDEEGNAYIRDLYLDLALYPNGEMLTLDEGELQEALEAGDINLDEFNLAHAQMESLKRYLANSLHEFVEKSDRYIAYFAHFL
ncbi:MAG: DUF402 domain-containing protein [Christensenellales bacterium]|jgi:predicted RNA-binding protein associated with RNAse of E/G family